MRRGTHPGPYSIPPRRSSDLESRALAPCIALLSRDGRCPRNPPPCPLGDRADRGAHSGGTARSEEHTSALQSPCNLVCRLLLDRETLVLIATERQGFDEAVLM